MLLALSPAIGADDDADHAAASTRALLAARAGLQLLLNAARSKLLAHASCWRCRLPLSALCLQSERSLGCG